MPDIEVQLRAAMHAAVDDEVASPEQLITLVMRRHQRVKARRVSAVVLAALAITVSTVVALDSATSRPGSAPASRPKAPPARLLMSMSGLPIPTGMTFEFLVATPNAAGWFSTATGRTEPIAGLPAVTGGYQFDRLAWGWAASPARYSSPCPENECAGPPTTFYFIPYGSLTATRIGTGYRYDGVDAGADAGTIWLVTYPRATTRLSAASFAQLVSTAGRPVGLRYRMPANYLMGRGVGKYLLLDFNDNETHFELWNPATRRVLGHFDNVVAQGPDQVVWSRCPQGCPLEITNVSTGKTVTFPVPRDAPPDVNTALSEDGACWPCGFPSTA
jgi:hypothetical protein